MSSIWHYNLSKRLSCEQAWFFYNTTHGIILITNFHDFTHCSCRSSKQCLCSFIRNHSLLQFAIKISLRKRFTLDKCIVVDIKKIHISVSSFKFMTLIILFYGKIQAFVFCRYHFCIFERIKPFVNCLIRIS